MSAAIDGSDVVAATLASLGVDTVFGLVGDANLHLVERLTRRYDVRFVSAAHEAAAVAMADGWSRVAGAVGIATVTHGPGLTNTVTALTEAARHRTSMLLVAGDTARNDKKHSQAIDQHAIAAATGALVIEPADATDLAAAVHRAVDRARAERLPVVLNLPVDLLRNHLDEQQDPPTAEPAAAHLLPPDSGVLDRALGLAASANRPVVLAGRGVVLAGAQVDVARFAEALDAPIATTLLAKDLYRDDPADLGIFGTLSRDATAAAIAAADCVVAFGASLNPWTTMHGSMLDAVRLIQVDADAGQASPCCDVFVHADARVAARAFTEQFVLAGIERSGDRRSRVATHCRALRACYPWVSSAPDTPVELRPFMLDLEEALPADRTVVVDAGRFMRQPMRIMSVPDPTSFVFTCNFAAIGVGMAAGVGAAIARPDRPTVVFLGDGGFMLGGLGEFNAAVRHGVDLIAVVCNDGAYGAEYVQLEAAGLDPGLTTFAWPDLSELAMALGGEGVTVRTRGDVPAALEAIDNRSGPVLVDVHLDPRTVPSEPR